MASALLQLAQVIARLRKECSWDAAQTHRTLVNHLIEETAEVVEAIESDDDAALEEELGDLLVQVYFHAEIASGQGRFDLEDVARGITEKLVRRHPQVFAGAEEPEDKEASWEAAKRFEKGRRSALDGIPGPLATLAKAQKVVSRARAHGVGTDLPDEPITAAEAAEQILAVVARAQACGIDVDQETRGALRILETRIRAAE